jgi:molybdopterin-guanine dinucleotide biosynthesis protein A
MVGGVVLAGGRSARMGRPKATLEWHGSTLVRRVSGLVARAVDGPVVVVRAPGQELPELPFEIVEDAREGEGPLQGIAAGLGALEGRAAVAYVSAVDVPLLDPAFVRRVVDALGDADAAVPVGPQPLAAAYRVELAATARRLLADGERRARALLEECSVRWMEEPGPESLDDPAAYAAARARPAPAVVVDGRTVRAATLRAALGDRLGPGADPELPLVEGDVVQITRSEPV